MEAIRCSWFFCSLFSLANPLFVYMGTWFFWGAYIPIVCLPECHLFWKFTYFPHPKINAIFSWLAITCMWQCGSSLVIRAFFPSVLWCSCTGNHPQEELTKFGYKSKSKVENFKNPTIFWHDLLETIFV